MSNDRIGAMSDNEFHLNDQVEVLPGLPAVTELEGRTGIVIGVEHSSRLWVIVLIDKKFSGRPDRGWLFAPDAIRHVTAEKAQAA
ncbi:hypothetical protein [Curtobacterium sp. MCSS17_016]|uniref:hypothetical protein n=1 Tax=Curtobacterium sp. MCSS17_016 TaxID=2175644 RepID=UPI000DAA72D5|nr:hypothetical protein [Curtobacterium sp. MCSS17_016]WIE81034.1 hypothetical protein DEJ19_021190 [Curtobacterium sp. MCSS17_016]